MGKDLYIRPFFTRDKMFNIEVPDGEPKAFITICDRGKDGSITGKSTVAAEIHELMNVRHALKLYREFGAERFERFAAWLNPKAPAGLLSFVHTNGKRTTTWGLSMREAKDGSRSFSVFVTQAEGGKKENRSFPIDPGLYLLLERYMERALEAVEENSLEWARARRQELFEGTEREEEPPALSPPPRRPVRNPFTPGA
ncbi:hypothetical protein SAMN02745206_03595 [Desulfacinum infernum DSM 9756]|uniref:Uncharacterized protein n=1 Tax=Desulfacinum infernum DSM 9756 TaxID=1121391 RepID=A0A1M5IGU9_9BACT|nr:hypothetical protein [Desulfacinum infernum]SHG27455.1 hypothetical protein SAMN02745206_03595 [Desulfacinum infernum DSM 9756]